MWSAWALAWWLAYGSHGSLVRPQFGTLNFGIAFVALFATLTTLGLELIVLREVVLRPEETHEILGTSFTLRVLGSIIAPAVAIGGVYLIQPDDSAARLMVSILSIGLLFQSFDTIDSYFQSQVQSKLTVMAKNSAFLLVTCRPCDAHPCARSAVGLRGRSWSLSRDSEPSA